MNTFDFQAIFTAITGAIGTAYDVIRVPLAGMLTLVAGCLAGGCATLTKDQVASQQMVMDAWSDFARENNVMFVGQAAYKGQGGLFHQGTYGIDTGLQAQAFFIFDPSKTTTPMPVEGK